MWILYCSSLLFIDWLNDIVDIESFESEHSFCIPEITSIDDRDIVSFSDCIKKLYSNSKNGKNLIGTFYQPDQIIIDPKI